MSKRYTGGVVSSAVPTVNAASASGIFTLGQQASAQSNNNWPPFKVEKSLRFRGANSAYLSRTNSAAPGNNKTYTISLWVKRGSIPASTQTLFYVANSSAADYYGIVAFTSDNTLQFQDYTSATNGYLITSAVFRDPAAWYHIVAAYDSTQATSSNRMKLYVNGVRITAFSTETYPAQNSVSTNNAANYVCRFGNFFQSPTTYYQYDGYMAETYFIDGQALTSSSFGATDKDGNWSPIAYTGTYGQNGWYLNFKDATSTSTIGYDYSGNGNNWSLSGFNVATANTTYDSVIDVPTDQARSNVRANYATLNSLDPKNGVMSNGNLTHYMSSNDYASSRSTIGMKGGKWYWEAKCETTLQSNFYMGIGITADGDYSGYNYIGSTSGGYSYDGRATKLNNGSSTSYGASYTLNDIIGVALDLDNGTIEYYKNGASQGVAYTGIDTTRTYYAAHWIYTTQISYNFGQQPFTYTLPTGFKSLNTFNLPEPTIKQPNKHFNVVTYTGNSGNGLGTTQSITVGFAPDMVWIKDRSAAQWNNITDSVRGSGKEIFTNATTAEETNSGVTLGSNGFTANAWDGSNKSGDAIVSWNWKAASSNTTNTDGTVTSQVRANRTAGFSIVTYTGTGSGGARIGHGLGVAPKMMIVKQRGSTTNWAVYHQSLPSAFNVAGTQVLNLNTTASNTQNFDVWDSNETEFNRFSVGASTLSNANGGTYVAYCFAEIAGYSAFGKYTGNGSTDGPFVYTGFRPKFIMIKCSTNVYNWVTTDAVRDTYNTAQYGLYPNLSDAEGSGYPYMDILSNGFKLKYAGGGTNASGETFIYAAFAEMPFKYARSR